MKYCEIMLSSKDSSGEVVSDVTISINAKGEIYVDQVALNNVQESGQQSALVTFIRVGEKEPAVENQVQTLDLKFRQWLTIAPQG